MLKTLSTQRIWLLRICAIGLPFAALALFELVLRLAGAGNAYPLFVTGPEDERYRMPNPDLIERFFPDGMAPALTIETNFFLRDKPADGIRIFVQGGSSAAGFPYGGGASLAGLLGYRLQQSFPARPVEVIDTAMSAVTSHVLLDLADEIIAERPDAVMIYAGHNEFLGVLGVGSNYAGSGTRALKRLTLQLDGLRFFQLARNLALRIRLLFDEPAASDATTLMAAIARERELPLDSETYQRGVSDFRANLSALIGKYRKADIPVFVGTLVSNLKDQAPFISAEVRPETAATSGDILDRIRSRSFASLTDADLAELERLAAAEANADLFFMAGNARAARGEFALARDNLALARDHDLLRFRASSDINRTIREIALATGAIVVDVEAAFAAAAPNGLVGYELILEHLHPTADGYFLLADAYYQALLRSGQPERPQQIVDTAAARDELWIFPAERYFAEAGVAELAADFPFSIPPRRPELPPVQTAADEIGRAWFDGEISWLEMAEASRNLVAAQPVQRAIASQRIADALPWRADLRARAAHDWAEAGQPERAARYLPIDSE